MNMEENIDQDRITTELKECFPDRSFDPRALQPINFGKWKVMDIKTFLKIASPTKGISKLKKEDLIILAMKTWQKMCSESYCETSIDIPDLDLFSIPPSSSSNSLCSPTNTNTDSFSYVSSTPTSPMPTLQRYPNTTQNMTQIDFNHWTVAQLQDFLADRGINKSGNKQKLVENVFGTYKMNLPIVQTDAAQESKTVKDDRSSKLTIENGLVTLPDPNRMIDNWVAAPSLLPDTLHKDVEDYLIKQDAGKAFNGGKSLLQSGHIFHVMVNTISPNIRYCFVKGLCYPEQKFKTKEAYTVWICLHKDSGAIATGDCTCVAGVGGFCKHVGALLWYVEEQVRLGNNKTCTSKKQKWSVPSKKAQSLHTTDVLHNIKVSKPSAKRILSSAETSTTKKKKQSDFEPRLPKDRTVLPLSESEVDILADITNGNSGIICLLRKPALPCEWVLNLDNPVCEEVVTTSEHIELPKSINCLPLDDIQTFDEFRSTINLSPEERELIELKTRNQSENQLWFDFRAGRITASKFKDAVDKVNDNMVIKNPDKCKTFISKVCHYYKSFKSKPTEWGITNEPIARHIYFKTQKSKHKNFVVKEGGLYLDLDNPVIGASPDGLVNCSCHEPGILEVKCPWAGRDQTIDELADGNSFLKKINGEIHLSRQHQYYYQVQCQMICTKRTWCDFFVCTCKDQFVERIFFDEQFMEISVKKAVFAYKQLIFPELKFRVVKHKIEVEKNVKETVQCLIDTVCTIEENKDTIPENSNRNDLFEDDFDFDIDFDIAF